MHLALYCLLSLNSFSLLCGVLVGMNVQYEKGLYFVAITDSLTSYKILRIKKKNYIPQTNRVNKIRNVLKRGRERERETKGEP